MSGGYVREGAEGNDRGDRLELGLSWGLDGPTRYGMGNGYWTAAKEAFMKGKDDIDAILTLSPVVYNLGIDPPCGQC